MILQPIPSLEKATLRWLQEHSTQGLLVTDDRLVIRGWNGWLETRSGKNADALIGSHLFEAFPDLVQRRIDRLYQEALAGQIKMLAHRFRKYLLFFPTSISATLSPFMLQSAQITPLTDDSGQIIGTLTAIEDVTERVGRENALTQEKNLANKYLDIAGVIMLVLDTEGRVQRINKKGCEILGFSEIEIIGKSWFAQFVPERERQDLLDNFEPTMADQDLIWNYVENFVVTASGAEKLIAWHNILLRDDSGKITGTLSSGEDITLRKEMESQIIQARDEWVSTFNAVPDLIAVIDREHRIVQVNQAMADRLGVTPAQAIGLKCHEVVHGTRTPPHFCPHQALLMDHAPHEEDVFEPRLGGHFQVTVTPRYGRSGELAGSVHVAHDINERKLSEETARALSLSDALTGLYNRRGFVALAEQQLKTASRQHTGAALIFADLDGLKAINDTLGHTEGDRALIETALILKKTFRGSDIVARLGGDEFVVFAMETEGYDMNILTRRIQHAIEAANAAPDHPYTLSLSIGISRFDPHNPSSLDALLAESDSLMYENKQKKRAVFQPG
jgi:diguanylate cyclase (GGDEF)-like protein/PAS domain S-box-containing protein